MRAGVVPAAAPGSAGVVRRGRMRALLGHGVQRRDAAGGKNNHPHAPHLRWLLPLHPPHPPRLYSLSGLPCARVAMRCTARPRASASSRVASASTRQRSAWTSSAVETLMMRRDAVRRRPSPSTLPRPMSPPCALYKGSVALNQDVLRLAVVIG